jgi:HEAT repeat protein
MPVKASAARTIVALVGDLSSTSATVREAAIARLTVIGARAVKPLISLVESSASVRVRVGALRALDAIGDPRALPPGLGAIDDRDSSVAVAAVGVARRFLRDARGAAAVDRLTAVALDRARPDVVRTAALHALHDLDRKTIAPLLKSLARDPIVAMSAEPPVDSAMSIQETIVRRGADLPLGELLRFVELARDRDAAAPPGGRVEWAAARAAAHLELAKRGSRIALYDVREWLEAARQPLPADALAALSTVGDASCLEPIAKAHARSRDASWRQRLADAFRAVTTRERLTRRHAVIKKIEQKWPDLWARGAGRAGWVEGAGGAKKTDR